VPPYFINTTNVLEVKGQDKIIIDLSKATPQEKIQIKEKVLDVEFDEKGNILESHSSEKTKQIKKYLPKDKDEELLRFYRDKLNLDMYKALEASLIVRNSFGNFGENTDELKWDISRKYPEFGNNICNLVTQGYFDKDFKDLYNSMLAEEDFDIRIYQQKVERIVKSLPYIVFVTRYKSYDELSGEVRYKLKRLKMYGTGKLRLHAFTKENVSTTLIILDEYKADETILIEVEINPSSTVITATLKF